MVLVFAGGASELWGIDCSRGSERGYIRFLPPDGVDDNYGTPIAGSLGAMLNELCDAYADGGIYYVAENEQYEGDVLRHWWWEERFQPPPKRAGLP